MFDFPKADYDGILSYLCDFDYNPCLQSQDVEFIWITIKNSILTAMNLFIPKVRLRRQQFPCWYTPELRHLSKCLRSSKKRFSKHPTSHLQQKINDLELQCRNKYCKLNPTMNRILFVHLRVHIMAGFMTIFVLLARRATSRPWCLSITAMQLLM